MIDYQVKFVDFPRGKVHESVTENEDGSYTIFIDCRLSESNQRKCFIHAMEHILGKDFDKYTVEEIERKAHSIDFSKEISVFA